MSSRITTREEEEESGPEEDIDLENQGPQKKVFEDEQGDPIWFFLHKSIALDWQRNNLTNDIEACQANGGIVRPDDSNVDTVLVNVNSQACNKENLQLAYSSHRDPLKRRVWVEPMVFVSRCLRDGVVRHRQPEPKGMGGSLGDRTPFTSEDDDNLARYLAIRIPDVKNGGRRGEGVYKELYKAYSEDPEGYGWVKRHPWQSWRNRYNKNVYRFNPEIERFVEIEQPERKHAYGLIRKHKELHDGWEAEDEEPPASPLKKHRIDFSNSPAPAENHIEVRRSSTKKGKERAIPEEEINAHHKPRPSPFYDKPATCEPGPSKKTPIKTYARRRAHASSPLHDREPYTSQATLVEPSHQPQESRPLTKKTNFSSPTQREHSNLTQKETGVEVQQNRSLLSLREPNGSAAPAPSIHISSAATHTKTVSTSPHRRQMARKMARRPKTQTSNPILPADPPYRNTRSRSRSVEPSVQPSRSQPRRKKGTTLHQHGTTLPSLEESVNEIHQPPMEALETNPPPAAPSETHPLSAPIGETWEERNVEDLLITNINERSPATEGELQTRAQDNPVARSAEEDGDNKSTSMDSDDAQTNRWLRQQARVRLPSEELDISPHEMLRRFREASVNTARSSLRPSVRSVPFPRTRPNSAMRPRHSAPVHTRDVFGGAFLTEQQPRTPATNANLELRRASTSSIESFPIAGTKASAAKKKIEREGKRTPYRPPDGTRAALLTKEQDIPRAPEN